MNGSKWKLNSWAFEAVVGLECNRHHRNPRPTPKCLRVTVTLQLTGAVDLDAGLQTERFRLRVEEAIGQLMAFINTNHDKHAPLSTLDAAIILAGLGDPVVPAGDSTLEEVMAVMEGRRRMPREPHKACLRTLLLFCPIYKQHNP